MDAIDSDADVYEMPASSAEDQTLIDISLEPPGLEQGDIEAAERLQLETELQNLQSEIEAAEAELKEYKPTTNASDAESRRAELERRIDTLQTQASTKQQELSQYETRLESAREEFDHIRTAVEPSGDAPIQCWPVEKGLNEQYQFDRGDLLLFYTGNTAYRFAAVVDQTMELESLGSLILGDTDRSRPLFLILSDVYRIQVDSSVIAELTDRDLESVQKVSRLSGDARDELITRFDGLTNFIEDARQGLNTLPPKPSAGGTEEWVIGKPTEATSVDDEPTSTDTTSAGSSTTPEPSTPGADTTTPEQQVTAKPEIVRPEATEPSNWQALADTLERHKQVVLIGPEGTGKRRGVAQLLSKWLDDGGRVPAGERILRTQFTTETDYTEFVLGQFGDGTSENQLVTGPFGQFVDIAAADASQFVSQGDDSPPKYVVVIEDFQNADPSQVFGEFWQALWPRNRGPENPVRVSGATATLWVPDELYLIGIADTNGGNGRPLRELTGGPFAVRQTSPDYSVLREQYGYADDDLPKAAREGAFDALSILALEQLNDLIRDSTELDDRHILGHMFLSQRIQALEAYEDADLYDAWQYDVFTTLAGYHADGLSGLQNQLFSDVPLDDVRLTLGTLHADPEVVHDIVESLAESHRKY